MKALVTWGEYLEKNGAADERIAFIKKYCLIKP